LKLATCAWAAESNRLARQVAYDFEGSTCGELPEDVIKLGSEHQQAAAEVIRELFSSAALGWRSC